jgi:mono/diheme cytochrome c family protein
MRYSLCRMTRIQVQAISFFHYINALMTSNKRLVLLTVAATLAAGIVLAALAGTLLLFSGWYNIGATRQHWQPVYTLLEKGMHYSVRHHARGITPPDLSATQMVRRGASLYAGRCVQCHGAPGVAQHDIGMSMQPIPGPLVDAARRWKPGELYWITRHGIKMSGMPAWEFRLADEDIWAVVAFMAQLPALSPRDYAAMAEAAR